eukprot:CAMPEP_0181238360 /NCGR_PEP_ID=MMETSP1096-20121128/39296_1 /TAXON_ID=156174 ORGANISM="Chrysochromulina ericina, Strain CCMP281" /NCGR_SAMPLE_ID=MMETSP1096 /ASSEMBLY_ACC=CAM_ASM_000453 /LENGTH=84 /DNA_ID=CAMNT_0023333859 /DNA_START=27 /DNA_END=277 /DNA_ORIENTATION=+
MQNRTMFAQAMLEAEFLEIRIEQQAIRIEQLREEKERLDYDRMLANHKLEIEFRNERGLDSKDPSTCDPREEAAAATAATAATA